MHNLDRMFLPLTTEAAPSFRAVRPSSDRRIFIDTHRQIRVLVRVMGFEPTRRNTGT